jgi:acyl carrier protein
MASFSLTREGEKCPKGLSQRAPKIGPEMTPPLDSETARIFENALRQVSVKDLGPVTAERELAELGLDSVSVAELVLVLEDSFNLSLEPSDVEKLKTFGELAELIRAKR